MVTLPAWAQTWLQARETGDAALALLTINHPQLGTYRFVLNTQDVVSRGQTFTKAFFNFDIVNDDEQPPHVQLSFPNVDPVISNKFLELVDPPQVTLEVISSAYPDEPIYRAARLELRNTHFDEIVITGDLARTDYNSEIVGAIRMTPARAPGFFARK